MALTKVKAGNILLTTPGVSSNDVTPATTQYVTTAIGNLIDTAPSTLNTLNELAAALGDDVNFSTTVTNSIATKLPLAGGTLTGQLIVDSGDGIRINAVRDATLRFTGSDTSIQADEITGRLEWYTSDTNNPGVHAQILTRATNTAGSGEMQIWSGTAGGIAKNVHFRGDQTVFNEDGNDMDFRVESDTVDHALFVQGSDGNVGIGTSTPSVNLEVIDPVSGNFDGKIHIGGNGSSRRLILEQTDVLTYRIGATGASTITQLVSAGSSGVGSVGLTLDASGNVGIGHLLPKSKLSIVSDGSLNTYSGVIGIENTAADKWGSITLTDDIDTASASSNYYLIGRGSTYADRHMSFHIPNAANYGSGSQPKFIFASTGADTLFSVEASTGDAYHKGKVGIGTTSPATNLHVHTTSSHSEIRVSSSASGGGTVPAVSLNNTAVEWGMGILGDNHLHFRENTASYASRLTIADGGSVGIGTTGPTAKLHVATTSGDPINIGLQNSERYWKMQTDGGFLTFNDVSAGDLVRMTLDTSGIVTMPYQPAFKVNWGSRAATGSGRLLSTNASDTVVTGRDEFNTGSHFSTATGKFTAPVAGTYLLGFQAMRHGSNGASLECRIKKNGGAMWARAYQGAFDQAHQYWSIVTTTKCAAGDYFQVYIGPSTSIYDDDTYFYGHLIG